MSTGDNHITKASLHAFISFRQPLFQSKLSLLWSSEGKPAAEPHIHKHPLEVNFRSCSIWTYLWACGLQDGGVSTLRGPGNTLYHMFMLPQLSFALLRGNHPDTHCLVVRAAGNQWAILVGTHHPHPLPVACKRLHAVPADGNVTSYQLLE